MPTKPTRGRWFVLAWVTVFVAVAGVVTLRDSRGYATSDHVTALEDSVQVLSGLHTSLLSDVNFLLTTGEVTRRGALLGLRMPSDSEIVTLRVAEDR